MTATKSMRGLKLVMGPNACCRNHFIPANSPIRASSKTIIRRTPVKWGWRDGVGRLGDDLDGDPAALSAAESAAVRAARRVSR